MGVIVIRILALDLSLTSTGYATPDGEPGTLPTRLLGEARLSWIRDQVLELEHDHQAELIAIEGYAYGRPNQAHQVGELGGVVRCALHDAGIAFVEVPPLTVKKYATGNGGAGKDEVLAEAIRRLDYQGSSKDEADALWLRACVLDAAGIPCVEVPKAHRDAITATGSGKKKHPSLVEQVTAVLGKRTVA